MRHPRQGDFQGDGDLTFDFFRGGAGVLGDDFDDGRRRVGIGFDVDVDKGIGAANAEGEAEDEDDQRAV